MKKTPKIKTAKYNSAKMAKIQKAVDERRMKSVQDLPYKDKKKMEYVEKTLEEFRRRDIPVYIYPLLPVMSPAGEKVYRMFQYNNLGALIEVKNDIISLKSKLMLHSVHKGLCHHVVTFFAGIKGSDVPKKLEDYLKKGQEGMGRIWDCFYKTVTKDPLEEQLLKEIAEEEKK